MSGVMVIARIKGRLERLAEDFGGWLRRLSYPLPPAPARYAPEAGRPEMHIMTSCTNADVQVLQVLLLSLSDSQPDQRLIFWFAHASVSRRNIARLRAFAQSLPNLEFHELRYARTAALRRLRRLGGKPDFERFMWLLAHEHLPASLERVLYIDALDMLAVGDLRSLYDGDFAGHLLLSCPEINQYSSWPLPIAPPARALFAATGDQEALTRMSFGYLNSGAIVLNLARFRAEAHDGAFYTDVARWAAQERGLKFGDQGLFTLAHGTDYVVADRRFNTRFFTPELRQPKRPVLLHFCGYTPKPHRFRPSDAEWQEIEAAFEAGGGKPLAIDSYLRIYPYYRPYYEAWWRCCARCEAYPQIAAGAEARNWRAALAGPLA